MLFTYFLFKLFKYFIKVLGYLNIFEFDDSSKNAKDYSNHRVRLYHNIGICVFILCSSTIKIYYSILSFLPYPIHILLSCLLCIISTAFVPSNKYYDHEYSRREHHISVVI